MVVVGVKNILLSQLCVLHVYKYRIEEVEQMRQDCPNIAMTAAKLSYSLSVQNKKASYTKTPGFLFYFSLYL